MDWLNLLWCFLLISFFGWLFSCLYYWVSEKKFYNKGFLTLPFCPTYGFSALVCYLAFHSLSEDLYIVVVGSGLLLSLITVSAGFLGTKILGCKPWDYSGMKFNIGSYLTFPFALMLGAGGAFSVKLLIPLIEMVVSHIPFLVSMIIALSLLVLVLADYVLSFVTIFRLKSRLKKLKENLGLLGDDVSEEEITELEQNYNRIFTDSILRRRMASAFPELQHGEYVRQLTNTLEEIKADNMKEYTAVYENEEERPFASGLCFEKLFALFLIGSFIGTCIETVYALIVEGHFECRVGVVYGPFIPVYGGGACLLTLTLYKLYKLSDTLVFIIAAAIGAFFEYICSWGQETFLGTVSWDYSDMPLNIGGRTCLLYSLFWGFLGLVWLRYIYPFVSRQIEKIPKKQGSIVLSFLVAFMVVNAVMTVSAVYRWNQRVSGEPAPGRFAAFLDETFDDERMEFLFPHMRDSESLDELKGDKGATPDSARKETAEKQHE